MIYTLDIPPGIEKTLDRLEGPLYHAIQKALDALAENPRPHGCKKLGGAIYRIRVRDWRIIYAVFDKENLVQMIRIVRRTERTYKNLRPK